MIYQLYLLQQQLDTFSNCLLLPPGDIQFIKCTVATINYYDTLKAFGIFTF